MKEMNHKSLVIGCACSVAVLAVVAVYFSGRSRRIAVESDAEIVSVEQDARTKPAALSQPVPTPPARKMVHRTRNEGKKPTFQLSESDGLGLSESQRQLIEEIRKAIDADDIQKLISFIRKLQASEEWPDGIPLSVRKAAIEALAWSGLEGLPSMVGFLADSDPDILEMAIDAFDDGFQEANGDRELSSLLVTACQAVTDGEAIESFLMELDNMRNSVAIETVKQIAQTGSSAAQAALKEAIEDRFGEGVTVETLDQWYNDPSGENRDAPDDEDMYGPDKDDDDAPEVEEPEEDEPMATPADPSQPVMTT